MTKQEEMSGRMRNAFWFAEDTILNTFRSCRDRVDYDALFGSFARLFGLCRTYESSTEDFTLREVRCDGIVVLDTPVGDGLEVPFSKLNASTRNALFDVLSDVLS